MTAPAIRIEQLSFRWHPAGDFCLDIGNFTVDPGKSLFLYGPSGAGKSTLLNLIGGVLLPQQGEVQLLGTSLGGLSAAARDAFRADHLGFIFQQFNLIPWLSVLENVLLPCRFSRRRAARAGDPEAAARRLLAALDMPPAALSLPASQLSVGQQQRVAAARALMGAPEIIIADEPTSALDPVRQQAFIDLLREEAAGAGSALVFVSHDQRLAGHFSAQWALTGATA